METSELITWGSIGKLAIAGIGLYVIQPLLLAGRDELLWKAIDKWILTGELQQKINELMATEEALEEGPHVSGLEYVGGRAIYTLDGEIVTKEAYDLFQSRAKSIRTSLVSLRHFIDSRRRRIGWLLRHYKQPEVDNPVDAMIAETRKSRERLHERIKAAYPEPTK